MTLSTEHPPAAGAKLPLGATIRLSYATYFRNISDVVRASWLWLIVAAAAAGGIGWVQASFMAEAFASLKKGAAPQAVMSSPPLAVTIPTYLGEALLILAGVGVAVAWHRRVLLNERPGLSGSSIFTLDFWRYVRVGIAIVLIICIPMAAILVPLFLWLSPGMAAGATPSLSGIVLRSLIGFLVYIWAFVMLFRLILLFPARATGDTGLTFKEAWNRSGGNGWRIFWGVLACTVPPMIVIQFVGVLFLTRNGVLPEPSGDLPFSTRSAASFFAIAAAYNLLILPISIGFVSFAYRHLVRHEPLGSDGVRVHA